MRETRSKGYKELWAITATATIISLEAIFAQLRFSLGPIPYTMQTTAVFMGGLLLPPKYAALSQGLYVLLISLGLPIASGLRGGLGVVLGYTGGYLAGFILASPLYSLFVDRYLKKRGKSLDNISRKDYVFLTILSLPALAIIYFLGFIVFLYYSIPGSGLFEWSKRVFEWVFGAKAGDGGDVNRPLIIFTASVLIFIPKDIILGTLLAISICHIIARSLRSLGVLIR
jgi:biotin transport system substrate-specific component